MAYLKFLFDEAEEHLDVPTSSIGLCDLFGGEAKVIGDVPKFFRIFCSGPCNDLTKWGLHQFLPVMDWCCYFYSDRKFKTVCY